MSDEKQWKKGRGKLGLLDPLPGNAESLMNPPALPLTGF